MRTFRLLYALLSLATAAAASYTYYYTDPLTSINNSYWSENGSLASTSSGLTAPTSGGGSLVSTVAVPDGTNEYEVRSVLTLATSGGTYVQYVMATPNALTGPTLQGSFEATEIENPQFIPGQGCIAGIAYVRYANGTFTQLAAGQVPCRSGMVVRTVRRSGEFFVYVDNIQYAGGALSGTLPTGTKPGIGAFDTPAGNSIGQVQFGPLDRVAPNALTNIQYGAFAASAEFQWSPGTDDPNGTGIYNYSEVCNKEGASEGVSGVWAQTFMKFPALTPATNYVCTFYSTDFHGNEGPGTAVSFTTQPAQGVDPLRTGVQPNGSYWGGMGEDIDLRSGNLSFSIPLIHPQSRGWGLALNLSYNSQDWEQSGSAIFKESFDNGFGFGWTLQLGSLQTYGDPDSVTAAYVFTDGAGAQYPMVPRNPSNPDGTFVDQQGLHLLFDANTYILFFPDGTEWYFGSVSAPGEPDAGTDYPTTIADTNGNTIVVNYMSGSGINYYDTSGRIASIEDVRAVPSGSQRLTYTFSYDSEPTPHLTGISNLVGSGENYTFSYQENTSLYQPFSPQTLYGTTDLLSEVAIGGTPLSFQMLYSSHESGELSRLTFPHGGEIGWTYRSFTFAGSHSVREIYGRTLTPSPGAASLSYAITRSDSADASHYTRSQTNFEDPSGTGYRSWYFNTNATGVPAGYLTGNDVRNTPGSSVLLHHDYAWTTDSGGTPYLSSITSTLDPGTSGQQQSKVAFTQDGHGNISQTQRFDYGNLTAPARTYTSTYLTDPNYTQYWIWNRPVSTAVSGGGKNVTLYTNTYDSGTPVSRTGLNEWFDPGTPYRGNVTQVTRPWSTANLAYDSTGMIASTDDAHGHTAAYAPAAGTNNAAVGEVTPNNLSTLSTSYGYDSSLRTTSTTAPNNNKAALTFDSAGRVATSTSPDGAATTYSYGYNPSTITATTNGHWVRRTLDGLGRTAKLERGDANGTTSAADTTYGPGFVHPFGAVQSVSRPYAPGSTVYTTQYSYDGRGRPVKVSYPNNSGSTTYAYLGNTTTATDPTGRWKQYTYDALQHMKQVAEPNPAGGNNLTTNYAYDLLDRLNTASLPRGAYTQTHTFTYDPSTQRLSGISRPENGAVGYAYNADGTVASRTDNKGQKTAYNYDSLGRVSSIQRYPNGTAEDLCQRTTFSYDSNPYDSTYSGNALGRTTAAQYGGTGCASNTLFTEMYSYTPSGRVAGKRLRVNRGNNNADLNGTYSYDNEGRMTTKGYPNGGPTYTYGFDTLGRPVSLTDNASSPRAWVNNVNYAPDDQLAQWSVWNGSVYWNEARTYDARGQISTQKVPGILDMTYLHSPTADNGQITGHDDAILNQNVSYTYDALGRLATAKTANASQWGLSFGYDGFGNRTNSTLTQGTGPQFNLVYDGNTNHVQMSGFGYDANGNTTLMPGGTALGYDVENRLTSVNNSEFYGYGPQNHRVWKKEPNGSEEIDFYAPNGFRAGTYKPVVTNGTLSLQTVDTDLNFGNRVIQSRGNSVLRDRLGSVRAWGGTVTHSYYPFGEEQSATASDHDKYGSYYRDQTTGFDFARNRHYNSSYGTFLTADPYGGSARLSDPGSWNRYAYAGNDPIDDSDPSGLDGICDSGAPSCQGMQSPPAPDTGNNNPFATPTPPPYQGDDAPAADGDPVGASSDAGSTYTYKVSSCAYCNSNIFVKALVALNSALQPVAPVINQTADNMVMAATAMLPGAGEAAAAGDAAAMAGDAAAGASATSTASEALPVVNLGGEGEVAGAINQQGQWVLSPSWASSQTSQTLPELQQAGNQFVISTNTQLPFADQSVGTVVTNNVPVGVNTWQGPGIQPSEIWRILAPGGQWINNGVPMPPPIP